MHDEMTVNLLVDETGEEEEVFPAQDERDVEATDTDETDEKEGRPEAGGEVPVGEPIKVAVDWVEFEGALENNSPELRSFLNKITGDVIRVFEGGDDSDLKLRQTEESSDYIFIEPISSREQYRWMEEFIEVVEEPTLKEKLNIAIDGKGAFRRFKDVLMGYPNERERWFAKRSTKLHAHMAEWLKSKNVQSMNIPPWEAAEDGPRSDERRGHSDADARGWRESAADLRSVAHDMVDLVPSRELPTAVAFLEFLRGRRSFRRQTFS